MHKEIEEDILKFNT